MENHRIPSIRFKGFSDAWEQCKFKDLAETKRGLTYKPIDVSTNGIRVLRSSNINEDYFEQKEDDVFVAQNAINIDYVKSKDILITSANGSSRLVGKHAIITNMADNTAVHGGFMLLARTAYPYFLNASMSSRWYEKFISLNVAGGNGAIGNLSKSNLDDYDILAPSDAEKLKIGELFKSIDSLITLHQRKCQVLINTKKALLEKMFPSEHEAMPKIRFKGFSDAWEQRKLNELGNVETGNTPSTSIKEYYSEEGLIWITPTDITSNITLTTEKKLSKKGEKVARVIPANSILCTCIASIGKNTFSPVKCAFNQQINALIPSKSNDPYFLFVDSYNWSQSMLKGAGGLTFQIVNKTEFSNIVTFVPSIGEQKKIGYLFYKLDNLITLHQRKCEKLKNMKKSLLEKMFI
jgi:type I restriction enzyme S subunit